MQIYCVGGAVRDRLLGLPIVDKDWVVVGAKPEDMLALGYRQVGKDFPVFLHPITQEEYALARTERKTGPGYHGFSFNTDVSVTLEEDLKRRDLTINAIAQDDQGRLIDPFGGERDLQNKCLRHVSDSFSEDPVRLLRVARFAARFAHLGFQIDPETVTLMQDMVRAGEADALVPERCWREFEKALLTDDPQVFITSLRSCGALIKIMPELDKLYGVPQNPIHHPEIDTGKHCEMVLKQAACLTPDPIVRFAAWVHDIGKGLTAVHELPRHPDHEKRGVASLEQLGQRLKIPQNFMELAKMAARFHGECHDVMQKDAQALLTFIHELDPFRKPERFEQFLLSCKADFKGRTGYEDQAYPQSDYLAAAVQALNTVQSKDILAAQPHLKGAAIKDAIREQQLQVLHVWLEKQS